MRKRLSGFVGVLLIFFFLLPAKTYLAKTPFPATTRDSPL